MSKFWRPALVGLVLTLVLAGCGGGGGESVTAPSVERSSAAPSAPSAPASASPAASAPPVAARAPADGKCAEAAATYVKAVEATLTTRQASLEKAKVLRADGFVYFGANILAADGSRLSSSDVWVAKDAEGTGLAALSSDARDGTAPDGRRLYDLSAGAGGGDAVQKCVQAP